MKKPKTVTEARLVIKPFGGSRTRYHKKKDFASAAKDSEDYSLYEKGTVWIEQREVTTTAWEIVIPWGDIQWKGNTPDE